MPTKLINNVNFVIMITLSDAIFAVNIDSCLSIIAAVLPAMAASSCNDTGQRIQVEQAKRIKQWWFVADNVKLVLSVRYGTKVLELAKGKWAVEVGTEKELVPTLELLKGAVLSGELDTQIEAAANKLRDGFGG
jgi:hypothetical protein